MDISSFFFCFFSLKVRNTFVSWAIWIFIRRTGPKYEHSYNLANLHEKWPPPPQKKALPVSYFFFAGGGGSRLWWKWIASDSCIHLLCILFTCNCIEGSSFKADRNSWNILGSACIFPKTAVNRVVVFWNVVKPNVFTRCKSKESMMPLVKSWVPKERGFWMA